MKTLSLKVEVTKEERRVRDPETGDIKLMPEEDAISNNIKNIILFWGVQKDKGLSMENRDKYYRISTALRVSFREGRDFVELEDDLFALLKKARKEVHISPTDLLGQIEANIEAVK